MITMCDNMGKYHHAYDSLVVMILHDQIECSGLYRGSCRAIMCANMVIHIRYIHNVIIGKCQHAFALIRSIIDH